MDSSSTNDFSEWRFHRPLVRVSYAEEKRNCGCGQDPCVTYGAEPEMRRRVRTMTGRPHKTRKLVKDQAITLKRRLSG